MAQTAEATVVLAGHNGITEVDLSTCQLNVKSNRKNLVDNTKCQTHNEDDEEDVADENDCSQKNCSPTDNDNENVDHKLPTKRKRKSHRKWLSKSSSSSTLLNCIICNLKRHHSLKHQRGQNLLNPPTPTVTPTKATTLTTAITTTSGRSNPLEQPAAVVVVLAKKDSSADHQVYATHLVSECRETDIL